MLAVATLLLAATLPASPSLETALSFGKLGVRPLAGSIRTVNEERHYQLNLDIALEPDQQWYLVCQSPAVAPEQGTSCHLTRTTLDHWGQAANLGTKCYQSVHTTAAHTLEVVLADWPAGKLELNVLLGDGSKINTRIRLANEADSIYLDSLTASSPTVELRVPDYTYVQQVPIVMKGLRSAWERNGTRYWARSPPPIKPKRAASSPPAKKSSPASSTPCTKPPSNNRSPTAPPPRAKSTNAFPLAAAPHSYNS